MTYYHPCFNCMTDKAACPTREKVKAAIKGLGLTSINFPCPDRAQRFRRGQRVSFDWRYYDDDGSGQGYTTSFTGTIMHEKKGNRRFVIRVDQDVEHYDLLPKDILKSPEFVSVRHDDITAIEEPDRAMCAICSAYDNTVDMAAHCWNGGTSPMRGCMRDTSEAHANGA